MKYIEKYDLYIDDDCIVYRKPSEREHLPCSLVQVMWYKNYNGYIFTSHWNKNTKKSVIVYQHRIIAEAFVKNPDPVNQVFVDHINGVRDDNRVSNLRFCTRLENNRSVKNYRTATSEKEARRIQRDRENSYRYYHEHIEERRAYDRLRRKKEREKNKLVKIIPFQKVPRNSEVA